jgi:transposase
VRKNDARSLDHKTLEEIRIRAVERVQAGESPEAVVKALGFSRACIYNWLALYRTGGWGALKARVVPGRPQRISGEQMQWLYNTIVGKNPLQFRFEFALWTRPIIQTLLREEWKLKLSLSSIGRLLKQLGLTCQRPLFRASEQNPARVNDWLAEQYPAIRALAKQEKATIFFADEAGVRSDYHAGTTWGAQGKTPVVIRSVERARVNMLSAISAKGELRFMLEDGKVTGTVFVEFLRRLLVGATAPIFLIVDGAPIHKAKTVKAFVASTAGRLRLFFLPPYSPELNPDEQVWNYVKNHGVGREGLKRSSELRGKVLRRLRSLQQLPWTVRMFFLLPDTQYAAA